MLPIKMDTKLLVENPSSSLIDYKPFINTSSLYFTFLYNSLLSYVPFLKKKKLLQMKRVNDYSNIKL